jgi:Xaa-Pro aminopeptidase
MRRTWFRAALLLFAGAAPLVVAAPRVAAQADPRAEQAAPAPATLLGQPSADYAARRKALMARIREAESRGEPVAQPEGPRLIAVVKGGDHRDLEDFEEGRFRQSNTFAYLTGLDVPGACLVLFADQDRDVLYVPPSRAGLVGLGRARSGPQPGRETAEALGYAEVLGTDRLLGDLFGALADPMRSGFFARGARATVYTERPSPRPDDARPAARFVRYLREGAPATNYKDLAPLLGEMRKIKSPAEVALLQRAIDITGDAQRAVAATLRPGIYEYQLEGKILGAFLDGGALRPGFASIVGSGPNSCIPHYFDNDRQVEDGDLVVVDIGAEYRYYTADVTRTFPASGRFTPRQRELYQTVLDAQRHAEERFRPGETRLGEMTGWVHAYLAKSPLRAKDSSGREQTLNSFFIHGLGHYLGMDVHDVGDGSKPMQPGEVFTIEPGLYIPSENIGIRIEDDYLVTESGLEKLTKAIPSEPDAVERWMAEARDGSAAEKVGAGGGR